MCCIGYGEKGLDERERGKEGEEGERERGSRRREGEGERERGSRRRKRREMKRRVWVEAGGSRGDKKGRREQEDGQVQAGIETTRRGRERGKW